MGKEEKLKIYLYYGQRILFLFLPALLMLNIDKGVSIFSIFLVLISIGNMYLNKKILFTFYEKFLLVFVITILISIIFQNYAYDTGIHHLKKHIKYLIFPFLIGQLKIDKNDIKFCFISLNIGILGEIIRFVKEFINLKLDYNISYKELIFSNIPWNYRYFSRYDIPQTAMILGATFIIFYYLMPIIKDKKQKIYIFILLIISGFLLLSVQSRGMTLALFIIFIFLAIVRKEKFFKVTIIGLILFSFLGGYYLKNSNYINRYQNVANDVSFHARVEVYKESYRLFKNNKINGVGFFNFVHAQNNNNYKYNSSYGHSHNMALKMLAETGVIGFIGYYLFMGSILLNFWRESKKNKYYLIGFLVVLTLLLYENVETMMIKRISLKYIFFLIALGLNTIYYKNDKIN